MKKSLLLLPLLGVSALMCGCVIDPYAGPGYAEDGPGYEPGYVVAYGEPLYVYGGMNYYYYGGRYCYLQHGRPIYVARVPYGAAHYHGPSYMHRGGGNPRVHGTTQPYSRRGVNPQGPQARNPGIHGPQARNPSIHGPQPPSMHGPQPHNLSVQGPQARNPGIQKMGQGGGNQNKRGATQSNQGQKKKHSDKP